MTPDADARRLWPIVQGVGIALVLALFLWASREILNPLFLFVVLVVALHPFRGRPGYSLLVALAGTITAVWVLSTTGSLLAPFILALGVALSLRTPPLTKRATRFLGTWTYSGSEGAKDKFMHFRADGSAHWWSAQGSGSYLEWAVDGDSMEFRQYTTKRSAQVSRLTALVYGPYEGDDYEIVSVSDDEFTLRRDYRDRETGEMKSGTTVYRRTEDEITESAE